VSFAVLRILDWFHIAQKFQNVKNALGEAFATSLERAKWKLWHGNAHDALTKLALLRDNVIDEAQRSKLTGLYDGLDQGIGHLASMSPKKMSGSAPIKLEPRGRPRHP
jgi:hypothetical protein